jgi:putative membrane protein
VGKLKRFFYRVLCGFFLGLSVFAPGFSGSVIAIIMGIYQDMLRIVSNPFKRLKQNILFCIPLGIGAVLSAVLFVLAFKFLFDSYEKATYFLFIGLITGNIPEILRQIRRCGFQKRYLFGGAGAFAAALTLGLLSTGVGQAATGITSGLPRFALSGLAGGLTALVPGMSVSMILILMRVYGQLITAAETLMHLDFSPLPAVAVFGACAVLGLVLASRGIRFLFKKYPGFANSTVLGFMGGSLLGLLVQSVRMPDPRFHWWLGGAMLTVGLATSMLFVVLGRKFGTEAAE